jgi:hypothetical protein
LTVYAAITLIGRFVMKSTLCTAAGLLALLTGAASAALHEVPYTGGKKAGTVVITKVSNTSMSPDTVKIGPATIRLTMITDILLAVCGAKPTIAAQFVAPFAQVWQTADTSTHWNGFPAMPASGLIGVDSIDIRKNGSPDPAWRAPGFGLFSEGPGTSCTGTEYFMEPRWNRVVFMRFGSGVDYRLKVSFQVQTGASENPTPMIDNSWLVSLTMHYVLNANSTDVSGAPVSIRAPRVARAAPVRGDWRTMDLYSPLGVKLRREPGRFEAVVPVRRVH